MQVVSGCNVPHMQQLLGTSPRSRIGASISGGSKVSQNKL